jgi:hypothetical protein
MLRVAHAVALVAIVLLGATQGCAMPVAFGRTGEILPAGGVRLGVSNTTGFAPTTARVTETTSAGRRTEERSYYGPDGWHLTSSGETILSAPLTSWEPYFGVSPFDRCELGAFASLSRVGGELRCGALEGELGDVRLALSAAAALPLAARPDDEAELRAGADLSLDGQSTVPFLNVYVASVPWRRGVSYRNRGSTAFLGYSNDRVERTEYRLSVPIGFALHKLSANGRKRGSLMVALVPEINLGSKLLAPAYADDDRAGDSGTEVRIEQNWALFVTVRGQLELLPAHGD